MTPREALAFIHSVSWLGSKPGLERTRELLARMGNPQDGLRFIHVAGTNGKGSVSAMLASILTAAGYRTGLYTSPYIHHFEERMRVDGAEITPDELAEVTQEVEPHALAMVDSPTEFELVTAIAMRFFRKKNCDIVVLEVGLGGRLDSTNVIAPPLCAVIMNIGLDHTEVLGETVEAIAAEKAAIIKPGSAAVIYPQQASVMAVVSAHCAALGVPLSVAAAEDALLVSDSLEGQVLRYRGGPAMRLPLLGKHQLLNAAVALRVVETLRDRGLSIPQDAVACGLENTRWPARFELVGRNPDFVVDGGHNPQCAEAAAAGLAHYFPDRRRVLLLGVLRDKDYPRFCNILAPLADAFVTITPSNPRALEALELAEHLRRFGKPVTACESVAQGGEVAKALAGSAGMVCSIGSLYAAGAVRAIFGLS